MSLTTLTLRRLALNQPRLTARGIAARTATVTPIRFASNEASPGQSSNVANPRSSSPESQSINISRGKEARHADTADTRSVQSPISSQSGPTSEAHEGEEQTPADAQIKNHPGESTETKRRNVEKAGERPLGVEDRQGS
ncbi:uncharacterized protein BP01DRAFT_359123 [Aspergillus saccharolyticus JOP 1030-1]|uniref:Uncharacterized protein n=1 Tax=Aspergillus saccharolyticus JOP 1030-1 TaxID=1450539 RepID=A0A318Z925_9EURO|nr:hypothetical protein BP01DRAFT_359123 [Aspergillus saccharolyticus JOP 1030-1]PYH42897.1 hypothetical protein BP01DRAFT_359123 [Aspergillus saccharolyticus JOP 1030-1]